MRAKLIDKQNALEDPHFPISHATTKSEEMLTNDPSALSATARGASSCEIHHRRNHPATPLQDAAHDGASNRGARSEDLVGEDAGKISNITYSSKEGGKEGGESAAAKGGDVDGPFADRHSARHSGTS